MSVRVAKTAGFCFGVNRAVEMALAAAESRERVYMLGQLIHNRAVTDKLASLGVREVQTLSEVPEGSAVIVRAHGVPKSVYEEIAARGLELIDVTCPFVRKIHRIAERESAEGRRVIIMGDPTHPEVIGISGWCQDASVCQDAAELEKLCLEYADFAAKPVSLVAQTTSNRTKWEFFVNNIKKLYTNPKIFDTICNATDERQAECAEIAAQSEVMLIIGDRNSSNTRKLKEVAETKCEKVYLIDGARELDKRWFDRVRTVGITAGASTPAWIIKEVVNQMSEELRNQVAAEAIDEAEENFEQMLENSIKTLYTGDKVTGIVTAINSGEINVDLGVKHAGYISINELSDDPNYIADGKIKVGDEIEAFVMRVNDVEGTVQLSKKRLDVIKGWDTIEQAREDRTTVEGTVIEENKGGVVVSVGGVHVFVPASQTGLPKDAEMSQIMKQKVKLRVIEVNRARRRVVGSIRAVAQEERRAKAEQIWAEIEENKVYNGVVKSLTSYGAFVDIGGVDGMIHISELSWNRVRHPSEVVAVGDEVEVYVISFDTEKKKISLGYRKAEDNPWTKFVTNYAIGDVVPVKVLKFMPFGAFAEVLPGVDGLIHISQIANQRINKPDDVLSENEVVNAKITDIDMDRQKISLSIRAVIEDGEAVEAADAE
ncbi:MAG: bifunctional 4-hydroxy-3-methylbut-2-enyl diphosphate reductase/30S ribosomal protein S1 [Ruminococcaceae bacterium]|nr:bifunctional 4-hydroxy-3-methylbut-2-enyl diphosphate reductase/30S ribosomal protein S1 [Oscillospiraceae bacterium]